MYSDVIENQIVEDSQRIAEAKKINVKKEIEIKTKLRKPSILEPVIDLKETIAINVQVLSLDNEKQPMPNRLNLKK